MRCFVRALIISTILLAILLYIFINKGDEWIIPPLKDYFSALVEENMQDAMDDITNVAMKDSVMQYFQDFVENFEIEEGAVIHKDDIEKLTDYIRNSSTDSLITSEEFEKIKEKIDNLVTYEDE